MAPNAAARFDGRPSMRDRAHAEQVEQLEALRPGAVAEHAHEYRRRVPRAVDDGSSAFLEKLEECGMTLRHQRVVMRGAGIPEELPVLVLDRVRAGDTQAQMRP